MNERLSTVREEVEAGSVTPYSLVLLFNVASDADHDGDLATLEQTLALARRIAATAGETLRVEAERLAAICQQSLSGVRERQATTASVQAADGSINCPECGNEVPATSVRCRRCGHLFM
jgi:predicted RNA-binding Zn-ribbon protein involved in translation (DUF1610 family)